MALGLVSCGSLPPLDDAYIWPDKKAEQTAQAATTVPATQSVSATQEQRSAAPTMEIISQKDTTITVRIKK